MSALDPDDAGKLFPPYFARNNGAYACMECEGNPTIYKIPTGMTDLEFIADHEEWHKKKRLGLESGRALRPLPGVGPRLVELEDGCMIDPSEVVMLCRNYDGGGSVITLRHGESIEMEIDYEEVRRKLGF